MSRSFIVVAVMFAAVLPAGQATAQELSSEVTSAQSDPRGCVTTERTGEGVVTRSLRAPNLSEIDARLDAGGDWDLAVTDAATGRVLAGSASPGGSEVAQGFAEEGQRLVVRACRISGGDPTADLDVVLNSIDTSGPVARPSLVKIYTPDEGAERRLDGLGLDLTEHAGTDDRGAYTTAVLAGPVEAAELRGAALDFETVVPDLVAQAAEQRAADREFEQSAVTADIPSGNTTYRRLFEYEEELGDLADQNPDLVTPIELPNQTYEGRTVQGIEITTNPGNKADGKPIFLQMGVHHAREWPSGEHAMEWAYELIEGYRAGDARLKPLVENTRTIVIPIVNPDGFNTSREAGETMMHGGGDPTDDAIQAFVASPNEYRRKNCRLLNDDPSGNCAQPSVGAAEPGVDPNRNYGGFWGGPGAGTAPVDADYRGPGPFSEPETQNIRSLISSRQVVTLITNHTFSNLVLRPPGVAVQGDPVDEPLYKSFGDAMAAENGYLSQKGFQLYDTTGTTEDWSYYTTGGLGFTFEIGCIPEDPAEPSVNCIGNFHPPFADTVAEYDGSGPAATSVGGDGNREAYTIAQESTADEARHSIIRGQAPPGAALRISKSVMTPTSPQPDASGEPILFEDNLTSDLTVPTSGNFEWHVNPSTRPLVAQPRGRASLGEPSDPVTDTGDSTTTTPPVGCADFETTDANCWNDHAFTIPGGAGTDNDRATVNVSWTVPVNDWDIKVFRDTDDNGSSAGEPASAEVGRSGNSPPGTEESTTFVEPSIPDGRLQPGDYVVRVVNFAAPAPDPYTVTVSFEGPEDFQPATSEAWALTCSLSGTQRSSTQVTVVRGAAADVDLRSACSRATDTPVSGGGAGPGGAGPGGAGSGEQRCAGKIVTLRATGRKVNGTARRDVIFAARGSQRISGGGGPDLICAGGGRDRVSGGPGADRLFGQGGKDKLFGGKGRDRLVGGKGRDRCNGGRGRDKQRGC